MTWSKGEALQAGAAAFLSATCLVDAAELRAAVVAQTWVLVWGHRERTGFSNMEQISSVVEKLY